jgi:hypothetical protein
MLSVTMVINTCFINVAVYHSRGDWAGEKGLSITALTLCASNAFAPLVNALDLPGHLRNFRRWLWERSTDRTKPLAEAERIYYESFFMPSTLNLSARYANAIKTFILAVIYSPLIPIGAPLLCFVGICSQYFADKVFILKYALKPYSSVNALMVRGAMNFIDMGVMLGGVFAGLFIGHNGTHMHRSFFIGVGFSVGLYLIKLLPSKVEKAVFLAHGYQVSEEKTARDADYYTAQIFWEARHMYHKSYPLYRYLPDELNPEILEKAPSAPSEDQIKEPLSPEIDRESCAKFWGVECWTI